MSNASSPRMKSRKLYNEPDAKNRPESRHSGSIPAIFPAETVAETENVGFQFHQIYRGGIMSFHDFPRKRLRKESRIREFRMAGIGMCDGESEFQWNKRGCVVF